MSFHPAQPFLRVRDRDSTIVELSSEVRRYARDLERRLTAEERARWDAVGSQRDAERAQQEEARQRAILEQRLAEVEDQLRLLRQHGDERITG